MSGSFLVLALALGFQPSGDAGSWIPFTSDEGKFVVDFPGKPTKSFTRESRSKTGSVKIVVVQCDTPDVLYTAQKVNLPPSSGLKPADLEAILDFWRDNLANEFNGRIVTQKKLRLGRGLVRPRFHCRGPAELEIWVGHDSRPRIPFAKGAVHPGGGHSR